MTSKPLCLLFEVLTLFHFFFPWRKKKLLLKSNMNFCICSQTIKQALSAYFIPQVWPFYSRHKRSHQMSSLVTCSWCIHKPHPSQLSAQLPNVKHDPTVLLNKTPTNKASTATFPFSTPMNWTKPQFNNVRSYKNWRKNWRKNDEPISYLPHCSGGNSSAPHH